MHLVKSCLDKQLIDHRRHPMGRVDGIVLELTDGKRPRVAWVEIGSVARASRIHPRLARFVAALSRRVGVTRANPWRLSFSQVTVAGIRALAAVDADTTPASAWERRLRRVILHIPGA